MTKQKYALLLFFYIAIVGVSSEKLFGQEHAKDFIFTDFSEEEESLFDTVDGTEFMGKEVVVEPLSRFSLAVRVIWDKMLITYLWVKLRCERCVAYVREKMWPSQALCVDSVRFYATKLKMAGG